MRCLNNYACFKQNSATSFSKVIICTLVLKLQENTEDVETCMEVTQLESLYHSAQSRKGRYL